MIARRLGSVILPLLVLAGCNDPAPEPTSPDNTELSRQPSKAGVRFSTFNASLNRNSSGELMAG